MPFISVIIPVYNAQEFLPHALGSIEAQDFADWEVTLVDDGSTDGSPALCDSYAERDPRFRVIHQENAGTSAARNTALKAAQGEYITFMDNDDWWRIPEALTLVHEALTRRPVDLLWHMSARANPEGTEITEAEPTSIASMIDSLSTDEAIRTIIDNELTTSAVWTKVIRRDFLTTHGIVFPSGMRNEDTDVSAQIIAHIDSVAWLDQRFYVYRMGHPYAQTSHSLAVSTVDDLEHVLRSNLSAARSLPEGRRSALMAFLARPMMVWVGQASALGLLDEKKHGQQARRRKAFISQFFLPLISQSHTREARIAQWACRLLGVRACAHLLGIQFRRMHPELVARSTTK